MSTRRLIMEAIDLSLHDAKVSDEMPQPGSDEPLGMPSIDISDEIAELGGLFEKAGNYQTLMAQYPEHRVLSVSEEKLFNIAANLSLAGTGFTAEDFKLAVKDHLGTHISQEGLGTVAKSIGQAIINAIKWIIQKIKDFWTWLTGTGGKNEESKDRVVVDDIRSIPDPTLQKVGEMLDSVTSSGLLDPNRITDLGGGVVVHGDTVVLTDNRPGSAKGSTTKVNLRNFMHLHWSELNHLFKIPPPGSTIDISKIPTQLKIYLDRLVKLAPIMSKLQSASLEVANSVAYAKRLSEDKVGREGPEIISRAKADWLAIWAELKVFAKSENFGDYTQEDYLLPDGTVLLSRFSGTRFLGDGSPWKDELKDVTATSVIIGQSGDEVAHPPADRVWRLKFSGTPSSIANSYDSLIDSYVNAFKKIAPSQDLGKLDAVLNKLEADNEEAYSISAGYTPQHALVRDLLVFQYLITESQAAIIHVLARALRMIGQHRALYAGLRKLAKSDNRPKKKK